MWWAVGTLIGWTLSGFGSARAAAWWGSLIANRWRLVGATALLLGWQVLVGWPDQIPGVVWFLLGGVLHLGLGDLMLYASYRLLGPRLGVLLCVCLAPPIAGLLEALVLGTRLTLVESLLALAVLAAVLVALAPRERLRLGQRAIRYGLLCGLAAAAFQGSGAMVTRLGYAACAAEDFQLSPFTGALLRCCGGLCVLLPLALVLRRRDVEATYANRTAGSRSQRAPWGWLALSTLAGPVFGVAAYQAALDQAPAALVQAVIAALPVTMIPLAWLLDGDRPSPRSAIGAASAVSLVACLAWVAQGR